VIPSPRRRGRWILAGGLVGLAMSPRGRRVGLGLRARAMRRGRPAADPVEPFHGAPCYEYDRSADAEPARSEAAR
jgi:hypothetical protein